MTMSSLDTPNRHSYITANVYQPYYMPSWRCLSTSGQYHGSCTPTMLNVGVYESLNATGCDQTENAVGVITQRVSCEF
jgi:hypothetical protein